MSVIAQANDDQTIGNFYAYSPYGQAIALGTDDGNLLQYTGRENDGTGLYYYRARYYDPILKRFISEDPIGIAGALNFAAYVGGNPVNFSDPDGLQKWPYRDYHRAMEEWPDSRTETCLGQACRYDRICEKWRCLLTPPGTCPEKFFYYPDETTVASKPGWSPENDPSCQCVKRKLKYK
jgi:RHS repeat-associated protein